ncbi:NlpC/P60 family protein [Streptosporangium sp. NPDC048047]|uniref:C40 family peptidase n=1 Tax=Streptosporangium sp. NPDC048047 TaxID=3155748 RepID=UPI00342668BE
MARVSRNDPESRAIGDAGDAGDTARSGDGTGRRDPAASEGPRTGSGPDRSRRRAVTAGAAVLAGVLVVAGGSAPLLPAALNRVTAIAFAIEAGGHQPGWSGGSIPYSWGGGHDTAPGPSYGTCQGYTGRIRPCPATATLGLDCSGLARWVYHLAYGRDVLGPGNTDDHVRRLTKVPAGQARPGDLVFYGKIGKRTVKTHHVGVYIGGGEMVNALRTGTEVRIDPVSAVKDFAGYFRYLPALGPEAIPQAAAVDRSARHDRPDVLSLR